MARVYLQDNGGPFLDTMLVGWRICRDYAREQIGREFQFIGLERAELICCWSELALITHFMAVRFQFQFAGAEFSRPSSPYRKWLRGGIAGVAVILAGLAYWGYLHHLTHGSRPLVAPVSTAVVKVAAPVVAAPVVNQTETAAPVSTPAAEALPQTLKRVANDSIAAVGNYLVKTAKATPAVPTWLVPSKPEVKPESVIVVEPPTPVVSKPVTPRAPRVYTDQERFITAAKAAFDNVIGLADKYPDAYGFQVGDSLASAKLGLAMPVYKIEETDRAKYRSGQSVKPLLKPARQWVIPVLMGDRICCMVEVKLAGNEYVPGKGSKSLAMAWNKINERWPAQAGFHPMLVVNPNIPGYYFTVPELPVQNLTDTIEMFYFKPSTSPAEVILASWR